MPLVEMKCPNCKKLATFNTDTRTLRCKYCGRRETHYYENAMTSNGKRTNQRFRQKLIRRK